MPAGGTVGVLAWLALAGGDADSWNQPRADAAGTSALAVEGVHAEPALAWRHALGEILCEPVVWGGVVFVAARERTERELFAFDAETGDELDSQRLGRGGPLALAAWNGAVIVVDGERVLTYSLKGKSFRFLKKAELERTLGEPCVLDGRLLVSDGSELHALDVQTLAVLASVPAGAGRPSVGGTEAHPRVATVAVGNSLEQRFDVLRLPLAELGGAQVLRAAQTAELGAVQPGAKDGAGLVLALNTPSGGELWFARSPRPLLAQGGGELPACLSNKSLVPIQGVPAFVDGALFGFGPDGALHRAELDGTYSVLVAADAAPTGARSGAVSATSDVLYLGNWAVERAAGRVLWCLGELDPVTPIVPLAGGRAAVGTRGGEIVGLVDPARTAARSTPAEANAAGAAPTASTPRPDAETAILADGSLVPGPLARSADGSLRTPEGRVLAAEDVAHAPLTAGGRHTSAQHPVYLAWSRALRADALALLEDLAAGYARDRFLDEAQRVLREADAYGLAPERRRELESLVAGKPENRDANAAAKRERRRADEAERRTRVASDHVRAARWCAERELASAAGALLADALELARDAAPPELLALAKELVPSEFPWRDAGDAPRLWLAWSRELLPAEARFLARDDPARKRAKRFFEGGCAIATQNLVLQSEECDPCVLGACVRKGEGTLRALAELLPGDPARANVLLQVRMHATRESYLELASELPWSTGMYAPEEHLSRFYVPRDAAGAPDARELASILAHELTHHHVAERWAEPRYRVDQPGFWISEGFADFVQDQVLELGRSERSFSDPTVLSLDLAAHAHRAGWLVPLAELVDTTQEGFAKLSDEPLGELRTRYTLGPFAPTRRSLFYDHSAALVFFLFNRCGERGRTAFVEALRTFQSGETRPEGWRALGWDSAAALERELGAFLDSLLE